MGSGCGGPPVNGVLVAVVPATWPACDWPVPLPPLPPPGLLPPGLFPPGLFVPGLLVAGQPSGGGTPGIGTQLLPGGMQKVLSGVGRQVLDGGVPGGMQKELNGAGRHVGGGGVGVLGGMQKELSGVGRQPLVGGLVGGLLLGAAGMQPPAGAGRAVPSTHDPGPLTPIGAAGLQPKPGSQNEADWATEVPAAVPPGICTVSVASTGLPITGVTAVTVIVHEVDVGTATVE
jgi:hypothetical protein